MKVVFGDWRDDNAQRRYPFSDTATLEGATLTLAPSLFIDGRLYPIGGNATLYLNRISRAGSTITFAVQAVGTDELATGEIDVTDIPATGEIPFYDVYGRPAGMLLSTEEALNSFSGLNTGDYEFFAEQTPFAAAVVVAQPDLGLRGVALESGEVLAGDVWLVGEDGVILRRDEDGSLRIDIIGDPFAARATCEDEEPGDPDIAMLEPYCPLKTINGIAPDAHGNFKLLVGSNQSLSNLLRIGPDKTTDNTMSQHFEEGASLGFVALRIDALGQRRFSGG
jgi:hypothetical protein